MKTPYNLKNPYRCIECGEVFSEEEADKKKEDEDFKYGEYFYACPYCGSIELIDLEEEEE